MVGATFTKSFDAFVFEDQSDTGSCCLSHLTLVFNLFALVFNLLGLVFNLFALALNPLALALNLLALVLNRLALVLFLLELVLNLLALVLKDSCLSIPVRSFHSSPMREAVRDAF